MEKIENKKLSKVGFMELLLASLVLSIAALSALTFQQIVQIHHLSVTQKSPLYRVLYFAQQELVNKMDEIPLRKNAEFVLGSEIDSAVYQASFDDEDANKICFDKDGSLIQSDDDPLCEIKLSYYRVREVDRNFEQAEKGLGSDFHYLPVSRIFIRARYPDRQTGEERVFYFSRLKTELAQF